MNMNLAKSGLTDRFTEFAPLPTAAADYDIVRRAIEHIRGNWRAQPEIDAIANACGVSATDLHHLFRRWCGLTPKAFLQALTLDRARQLLRSSASVLDTAYEAGLSGQAARSVRHPRGYVAGRMEGGRRRPDDRLRVSSLPIRHGPGNDDTARPGWPGTRRSRQRTCSP